MKVELKPKYSTDNPDDVAILAARGDQYDGSMVGDEHPNALLGTTDKRNFIHRLLRQGHFGPFEHAQAYFAVEDISRVAMAQITRHRHMSWDVQSMRAVDFGDKEPVIPPEFHQEYALHSDITEAYMEEHWENAIEFYEKAIEQGVPKEDARFFLPLATPVNLTFSANARSLMHFFDLRKSGAAQWEAREFAEKVLEEAKEWAPLTFEGYEEYVNNASLRAP